MPTRRNILHQIAAPLEALYGVHEARQIALVALSERTGHTISQLLTDSEHEETIDGLEQLIGELTAGRPLQYILGSTDFCGLRIGVREGVLIPRPETEELVRWVAEENPTAHRLLDVGTGSGCIALALKSLLPKAEITGADISDEALSIARENAAALGLQATFSRADALHDLAATLPGPFDVIVSNPPYIPESERTAMHRNVTAYEPETALFVPDSDPIRFYRAIAQAARRMLHPDGTLYYEIHERFSDEVCAMLRREGFTRITLRRDFLDKTRMVCCRNER